MRKSDVVIGHLITIVCRLFSIYRLLATGFSYFISLVGTNAAPLEWIPMREIFISIEFVY